MKNSIKDLNNYLFEQLERLNDEELEIDKEIKRAKAVANISQAIINNASLMLDAKKYADELGVTTESILQLENK